MTVNQMADGMIFRLQKQGGSTDNPGGNTPSGGSGFTLTGIPSQYNGKWATIEAGNDNTGIYIYGTQSVDGSTGSYTAAPISGGKVSIPLWKLNSSFTSVTGYSGSDTLTVVVYIIKTATHNFFDEDNDEYQNDEIIGGVQFNTVTFSNGGATRAWSQGDDYYEENGNGGGGKASTFTMTGIPSQYNGKYAGLKGGKSGGVDITGCQKITKTGYKSEKLTLVPISNGSVIIPLFTDSDSLPYTGNDLYGELYVVISSVQEIDYWASYDIGEVDFYRVRFNNGSATASWSQGSYIPRNR
jgi:hypothetical protein